MMSLSANSNTYYILVVDFPVALFDSFLFKFNFNLFLIFPFFFPSHLISFLPSPFAFFPYHYASLLSFVLLILLCNTWLAIKPAGSSAPVLIRKPVLKRVRACCNWLCDRANAVWATKEPTFVLIGSFLNTLDS